MQRTRIRPTTRGLALAVAAIVALAATPAFAQDETIPTQQMSTSDVMWFPGTTWEGQSIPGASASYMAYEEGISASVTTSGLEPGHAVTLWWVVFNDPTLCQGGAGGLRCGENDLLLLGGPEQIGGTILNGGGHIIGPDGKGTFGAHLTPNDTSEVFVVGPGLIDPLAADVHVVLRDHGPIQPGLLDDMLDSYGGGCTEAPEGHGELGDYECADIQFAYFEPTLGA